MSPMVVVAGRPNVGKSSLVNRIVGSRATVVEEEKGVTRDRKELSAEWSGVPFSIMDTGGWLAAGDALESKVSDQAERALAEADVILMVVDVTTGVTDEDLEAAKVIRRAGPPVRLVVNKVDGASRDSAIWEFVSLGLGDPYPVSSLHGRGTGDLLDEVVALLPVPLPDGDDAEAPAGPADGTVPGETVTPARRASPSSAGPTWASRPSSTSSWAKSAPSCTTCPAPPATPSTPWSRRSTGRCGSSTRRGCAARPRPTAAPNSTRPCVPCGPWSGPTSPCWSSTPPSVPRTRTSGWPSASASRAAPPLWS